MKKINIVIALITVVGLILAGCAGEPEPAPEPEPVNGIVSGIPWSDRELASYVIQDYEGSTIGAAGLSLARDMEGTYILKQFYGFKQQVAALLTMAKVRADNLKPISGVVTLANISPAPVVEYSFDDGILSIRVLNTEGDISRDTIDIPEDAYDDNELLFLLRAIPFKVGYTASFTNMIAAAAQKHVVIITVVDEEELQVPAGSFDAYKIELTMAGEKKYLWYGKDKPHYFLKLDDGSSVIVLEEIGAAYGF